MARRRSRHAAARIGSAETRAIAAAAIAAVASTSVIISGTAAQAMPAASTPRDLVGVALVDQPAVEHAVGASAREP